MICQSPQLYFECRSASLRDEVLGQIESLDRATLATPLARMRRLKQRFGPAAREPGLPPYLPHTAIAKRLGRYTA